VAWSAWDVRCGAKGQLSLGDILYPYARAGLHRVGLLGYFDPIAVSGDYGYRKPDRRLFQAASGRTTPTS
jgi:hypothetical protein